MATRKCGNIISGNILWPSGNSQILISRNVFVLLLILMVVLRSIHYSSFASHNKKLRTDRQWLLPNVSNRQKMSPPIIKPVKKVVVFLMEYVVTCLDTIAVRNRPTHKCVNELSIASI